MTHEKNALIIIGMQQDRMPGAPGGHFFSKAVIDPLIELSSKADLTIVVQELNLKADPLTHCVKGTKGANVISSIKKLADYTVSMGTAINESNIWSAFEASTLRPLKSLDEILKENEVKEVWIGGLYFEYCISRTAFDACALGYDTTVFLEATRSFYNSERAMATLRKAGVNII